MKNIVSIQSHRILKCRKYIRCNFIRCYTVQIHLYNNVSVHYCAADQKIKDIVPIAVGVALAALVVIVLVSYLIGRRRTVAAGGYERV